MTIYKCFSDDTYVVYFLSDRADAGIYTCVFKHRGSGLMAGSVAFNVTSKLLQISMAVLFLINLIGPDYHLGQSGPYTIKAINRWYFSVELLLDMILSDYFH